MISLPLFIVLYRKTANGPQGEDKREDCEGDLGLEEKIGEGDVDGKDKRVDGDEDLEDKIVDGNLGDKEVDGEDKEVNVKGDFFKTIHSELVPLSQAWFSDKCLKIIATGSAFLPQCDSLKTKKTFQKNEKSILYLQIILLPSLFSQKTLQNCQNN